jgi:hypothetical protein
MNQQLLAEAYLTEQCALTHPDLGRTAEALAPVEDSRTTRETRELTE